MKPPQSSTDTGNIPPRRWPLFLVGAVLFVLGPLLYIVQFQFWPFVIPWYVPTLAALGVLLMALSAWQRRSILRGLGMALFAVVCGLQWFILTAGTKNPDYTGPAQPGVKVPAFAATRADGQPFTSDDLAGGGPTVLLFFRGRW